MFCAGSEKHFSKYYLLKNIIPQCFHCGIMLIIGCSKSPQSLFFYSIKIFCSRLVSGCKEMMGCIVGRLQTLCEGCFF